MYSLLVSQLVESIWKAIKAEALPPGEYLLLAISLKQRGLHTNVIGQDTYIERGNVEDSPFDSPFDSPVMPVITYKPEIFIKSVASYIFSN